MTGEKLVRITRENLETGTVARLVAERGDEDTQLAPNLFPNEEAACFSDKFASLA